VIPSVTEWWLLGGLILAGLELAAPGAFMIWIGLACLGEAGLTWLLQPSFPVQVVAFALFSAAALVAGLALRRGAKPPVLNTPQSGLVGRRAECLGFIGGEGRVRVGGTDWSARLIEGAPVPQKADWLDVVDVAGMVLVVRPHVVHSVRPHVVHSGDAGGAGKAGRG
jgi:membrane protein implicated in regulation of membrane protease activity